MVREGYWGETLSETQLRALRNTMSASGSKLVWMVNRLLGTHYGEEGELLIADWKRIYREVYPKWRTGDWDTMDQDFLHQREELLAIHDIENTERTSNG